jgi:monovalent cation:H+ antiporter-2, CPA2 family
MFVGFLPQAVLLLGAAVAIVLALRRLQVPSSLAYLLVGILLGPHTAGPVLDARPIRPLAEIGIVFLLFTIGLSFSLPQLHTLRNQVLGLGTAQVLLTTLVVAVLASIAGLPVPAAFLAGAVFAQSSTTIIGKQLTDQGEEHGRHGRLGLALSVFQDVTAVPLVIVVPILGTAVGVAALAGALAWAFGKAALAFALVLVLGRWALRPLFHLVVQRRSAELFTLTVLFVSLLAAWTTNGLGLSMPFGAFLAGMMLGETEFRHQVESAIRPFRDVLLGLFFVAIGMAFDPDSLPQIWHWALLGALVLVLVKTVLVAQIVRFAAVDRLTAWRTGWLLAVGGEFGFALLAIGLDSGVIEPEPGQVVLTSVLFSMVLAPFAIRHNHALARLCAGRSLRPQEERAPAPSLEEVGPARDHVVICGYGRIGQSVARFLEHEGIPFVALDLDATRVKEAHTAGEPVYYGDASERDILEAVGVGRARLVVIGHEDLASALKALRHIRALRADLPVMVRTRDESHVEELRAAGATEVVPETLEAGLMIAATALLLLHVPMRRIVRRMQEQRADRYPLLREYFHGDALFSEAPRGTDLDRLHPVVLPEESALAGRTLAELALDGVAITALVRRGERQLLPPADTRLEAADVLVLFGSPADLERAERALLD